MAFNVGAMRNRVDVQRRSLTRDGVGGQSEVWTFLSTIWVEIKALTGRELEAAQAVRATDTHQINLRYYPGLSAKDRLVFTDPEALQHLYAITSVVDMEMRHRYMQCTAVEGLSPG